MSDLPRKTFQLPPEQAIRDKCFHPSGTFVEFPIEDVAIDSWAGGDGRVGTEVALR